MEKYQQTISKDGKFTYHVPKELNKKISWYCFQNNIQRTAFITKILTEKMQSIKKEELMQLSKAELIDMLLDR